MQEAVQACAGLRLLRHDPWNAWSPSSSYPPSRSWSSSRSFSNSAPALGSACWSPVGRETVFAFPTPERLAARGGRSGFVELQDGLSRALSVGRGASRRHRCSRSERISHSRDGSGPSEVDGTAGGGAQDRRLRSLVRLWISRCLSGRRVGQQGFAAIVFSKAESHSQTTQALLGNAFRTLCRRRSTIFVPLHAHSPTTAARR